MTLDIDPLLRTNPHAGKVFEKNQDLLSKCRPEKKAKYRLGDPYGAKRPVDDTPLWQPRPKASFLVT